MNKGLKEKREEIQRKGGGRRRGERGERKENKNEGEGRRDR